MAVVLPLQTIDHCRPAQYDVAAAQIDVDMAVMAITTLEASMIKLIQENCEVFARPAAEAAARERLSEVLIRLKDRNNYEGQAGRNLYEDVSPLAESPHMLASMAESAKELWLSVGKKSCDCSLLFV